ncbi:hypothetical protein K440DRAFT_634916 [Wilcoxina mikolae CBS 423.85]|nr:hypothetical protein K440DRAFT_634916 [Wilcoxina mikolae CBS 423.85]
MKLALLLLQFLPLTLAIAIGCVQQCKLRSDNCPQEEIALCKCKNAIERGCAIQCGLPPPPEAACGILE